MAYPGVLLAIDGNSLVHRSFHAQAGTGLRNAAGEPMWAVRGLLSQILAAVQRIGPDRIIVGFDDPEASVRRDTWPQYKATRGEKLETLVSQLTLARLTLADMGIAVSQPAGYEADDVIASAAAHTSAAGGRTVVVTSDRDAFSLISDDTSVLRIINGGVEASPVLTPERLQIMLGIGPHQYRDYAALRGDSSDNLPGVHGYGPKTASRLLSALGSAQAAFDDLAAGGTAVTAAMGKGMAARLAAPPAREVWELNCQVMAQRVDLELGLDQPHYGALPLPSDAVRRAFEQCQLPWTLRAALQTLAHDHSEPVATRATIAATERSAADRTTGESPAVHGSSRPWGAPRHFPRLQPKVPALAQLSLFD